VLNFVPDVGGALEEARRVAKPGATIAAYVWDYAERMELVRTFWDAAVALDPRAAELDEGRRFGIAQPGRLRDAWVAAGLRGVEIRSIETPTRFVDFDVYWQPFTTAVGPAPGYASGLPEEHRVRLRERLRASLPVRDDGSIHLVANAWAVLGRTWGTIVGTLGLLWAGMSACRSGRTP
jgi:SAM-dependent methyltransferase